MANIEWKNRGIVVQLSEHSNIEDLLSLKGRIVGSACFDNLEYQIWDFSKVSGFGFDSDHALEAASIDIAATHWNKSCKVAIIAQSNLSAYINSYRNEMSESEWEFEQFVSFNEAISWVSHITEMAS